MNQGCRGNRRGDLLLQCRILRLDRLRLRGPLSAKDEFLLAAIAQNLRKLAKLVEPQPAFAIPIGA